MDPCKMKLNPGDICPCAMEGTLKFLGQPWNIMIIGTLGNHTELRYGELRGRLGGISHKTLSKRLRQLDDIGIVSRRAYPEVPPKVVYSLTEKGMELHSKLLPLLSWAINENHPAAKVEVNSET